MPIRKRTSHFELVLGVRETKKGGAKRARREKAEPAKPGKAE